LPILDRRLRIANLADAGFCREVITFPRF
jgi:hypothetical protein